MDALVGICNELAWEAFDPVDRKEVDDYYIRASIEIYEEILYQLAMFYCIDNGLEELVDEMISDIGQFAMYPNFTIKQNAIVYDIYKSFWDHSDFNVANIKVTLDNLVNPKMELSCCFGYTHITSNSLYDNISVLFEKLK